MKKKLFLSLIVIALLNVNLFATTYVTSYSDEGANPLFNDIYSTLQLTGTYTEAIDENDSEDLTLFGANFNSSVFFMGSPVGGYFSMDVIPVLEDDAYIFDFIFGVATRFKSEVNKETYFNIGPALSAITQDETAVDDPYVLIYWGVGANIGYRVYSPSMPYFTVDVGASAKALWYDSESSYNPTLSGVTPREFRYSASGYVGFTYRWFAPDWNDDDLNVIVAL
ncbi:MAG: hypothetical protein ACPKM0_00610 [Pleomorphochaeta sp.]